MRPRERKERGGDVGGISNDEAVVELVLANHLEAVGHFVLGEARRVQAWLEVCVLGGWAG